LISGEPKKADQIANHIQPGPKKFYTGKKIKIWLGKTKSQEAPKRSKGLQNLQD
jgi:hypothetical protein